MKGPKMQNRTIALTHISFLLQDAITEAFTEWLKDANLNAIEARKAGITDLMREDITASTLEALEASFAVFETEQATWEMLGKPNSGDSVTASILQAWLESPAGKTTFHQGFTKATEALEKPADN